jgi:hypothetical protein
MNPRIVWILTVTAFLVLLVGTASAQQPSAQPSTPSDKTMSQSLGLVVFPAKGQTADQQSKDESYCYDWAMQQTGYNPAAPPPAPTAAPAEAKRGGAVKGAARGAATGAAVGATVGAIKGRRDQKKTAAAQQEAEQTAKAAALEQIEQYKKAYSACIEGKGYNVK